MKNAIIATLAVIATATAAGMTNKEATAELNDRAAAATQSANFILAKSNDRNDRKFAANLRKQAAEFKALAATMNDEIAAAMTEVDAAAAAFKTLEPGDYPALEAAIKRQAKANRRFERLAKRAAKNAKR